ncbi:MAG: ATP-dependent DNA helicase, partial [Candidatus Puniceispirillales bacterium]
MPVETAATARLPAIPVVLPTARGVIWIDADGLIETLAPGAARDRLDQQQVFFCHRRWTASRLGMEHSGLGGLEGLDLLELFAFVRPARFCLPTPDGVAAALGLEAARTAEDRALLIASAARLLLEDLSRLEEQKRGPAVAMAGMMAQGGWGWAPSVLAALGSGMPPPGPPDSMAGAIWTRLPENPQPPPAAEPGAFAITVSEVEQRLATMLGRKAEIRPGQKSYAASRTPAFDTPRQDHGPAVVLAEAGTGTGKTLGYLAPSTLWAETNKAP